MKPAMQKETVSVPSFGFLRGSRSGNESGAKPGFTEGRPRNSPNEKYALRINRSTRIIFLSQSVVVVHSSTTFAFLRDARESG
jgi:hypothetical protein